MRIVLPTKFAYESDVRRKRLILLLLAIGLVDLAFCGWWFLLRKGRSQDDVILRAARRYQVDPALIKAVIWRESEFDPSARGAVGEIGLMQVGEAAALEWFESEGRTPFDHEQLFDAQKNTFAGTWYLRKLLDRYPHTDDPRPYALADYNAGRRHVLRWAEGPATTNSSAFIESIDFPTTRDYVVSVLKRHEMYAADEAFHPRN